MWTCIPDDVTIAFDGGEKIIYLNFKRLRKLIKPFSKGIPARSMQILKNIFNLNQCCPFLNRTSLGIQ